MWPESWPADPWRSQPTDAEAAGDSNATDAMRASEGPASPPDEEPYVSPVPGCILLAIGALMVLLLAAGWLM